MKQNFKSMVLSIFLTMYATLSYGSQLNGQFQNIPTTVSEFGNSNRPAQEAPSSETDNNFQRSKAPLFKARNLILVLAGSSLLNIVPSILGENFQTVQNLLKLPTASVLAEPRPQSLPAHDCYRDYDKLTIGKYCYIQRPKRTVSTESDTDGIARQDVIEQLDQSGEFVLTQVYVQQTSGFGEADASREILNGDSVVTYEDSLGRSIQTIDSLKAEQRGKVGANIEAVDVEVERNIDYLNETRKKIVDRRNRIVALSKNVPKIIVTYRARAYWCNGIAICGSSWTGRIYEVRRYLGNSSYGENLVSSAEQSVIDTDKRIQRALQKEQQEAERREAERKIVHQTGWVTAMQIRGFIEVNRYKMIPVSAEHKVMNGQDYINLSYRNDSPNQECRQAWIPEEQAMGTECKRYQFMMLPPSAKQQFVNRTGFVPTRTVTITDSQGNQMLMMIGYVIFRGVG